MSVLRVLHQVMSDASFRKQPGASEVLGFAAHIVRHVIARLVPGKAEDAGRAPAGASHPRSSACPDQHCGMHCLRLRIKQHVLINTLLASAKCNTDASWPDETGEGQVGSEKALQKGLAAMMFVELLFWKNAHDSEEVRDEYHWKVLHRILECFHILYILVGSVVTPEQCA